MSSICGCGHFDWEHRVLKGEDGGCEKCACKGFHLKIGEGNENRNAWKEKGSPFQWGFRTPGKIHPLAGRADKTRYATCLWEKI